ncbi:MAG TPA: polysaccharide deacetylase family protein [Rudaea sp.]|jgi:peptidoglycan/xylan/chitin deacetylase (PgdA/CDA1 family)|nr:polysaccharide deacetylase family protein [Rudaea sp.]
MMLRTAAALGFLLLAHGFAEAEPVAVTFDDLPLNGELAPNTTRAGIVTDVLAILKKYGLPPVYGFVNAKKLEGSDDGATALRRWIENGQHVGNHTYSHIDLHKSSAEEFLADLRADEPVLELLDPSGHWRWLRYPYLREGDTVEKRRDVRAALRERGYRIAQVTLDYEDYLWNTPYARCLATHDTKAIAWLRSSYLDTAKTYLRANRQMADLVFGHPINHVLLLHLGAFSSTIVPDLFDLMKKEGFTFVTLEQAQSDAAYETDPDAGSKYGGTLLEQWMDVRHLKYPDIPKKPYKELDAICRAP